MQSLDIAPARAAYERGDWKSAHEALSRAAERTALGPDDLWRLATAAYLIGRDNEFIDVLERVHAALRESGDAGGAARAAFWIGLHLGEQGDGARATGWFGRARRVLEDVDGERVEAGYLLLPAVRQRLAAGDPEGAARHAQEAAATGQRFGDRDLVALAIHMKGRALLAGGQVEAGLALLDEAMVAVVSEELSPVVRGLIYCSVISACRGIYDLGRAHQWTTALADWCERQPDMVAYAGECRVYRAELMQFHGAWSESLEEARRATATVEAAGRGDGPIAGLSAYQEGETHRLMGDLEAAEDAYRRASRAGRQPQPGLALLRLARGDAEAAGTLIRRALAEVRDPLQRARLLPAHVEIMIALDALDEARESCAELDRIAGRYGTGVLGTQAAHVRGAVTLAEGHPSAALPLLRRAYAEWQALEAPYEAARVRVLLGLACRALGDDEGARLELDAAAAAFTELGAAPDALRAEALVRGRPRRAPHGLTPRELEVLELVATGRTNQAIGEVLFISEKTVARHVSNIFMKIGVSSRAAATAFAYQHGLAGPGGGGS